MILDWLQLNLFFWEAPDGVEDLREKVALFWWRFYDVRIC